MQEGSESGLLMTDTRSELPWRLVMDPIGLRAAWRLDILLAKGKWCRAAAGTGVGSTTDAARADAEQQAAAARASIDINALRAKFEAY